MAEGVLWPVLELLFAAGFPVAFPVGEVSSGALEQPAMRTQKTAAQKNRGEEWREKFITKKSIRIGAKDKLGFMKGREKMWIFAALVLAGTLWFSANRTLAQTPISLASAQTSRGDDACEIIIGVDRRDWLVGMKHGAPPTLQRAWLSDEKGREIKGNFLTPIKLFAFDSMGAQQFGWRVARVIPNAPAKLVFNATFVAAGAKPFHFKQDLRAGVEFNYKDEVKMG